MRGSLQCANAAITFQECMQKFFYSIIFSWGFLFFAFVPVLAGKGIDFLTLPKEVWSGENVTELLQEADTNALIVHGKSPALVAQVEPFHANNFPIFRVSLISLRDMKGVVLWGREGKVAGETFGIKGSENPQDYSVDLWSVQTYAGTLDLFGIGWADYEGFSSQEPPEVKILSMILEGDRSGSNVWGSIKRFFYPERLRPHSINALSGWFFGGKQFTLWWGLLFFLVVLILMAIKIIFSVSRKSIIAAIAILFLIFWGAYDMRRILDLAAIVRISWNDFVHSSRFEKAYYDLGDFPGFLNFVKDHSSEDDTICFQAVRVWPFNQGATYFLAPLKVLYGANITKETCNLWASYKVPHTGDSINNITIGDARVVPEEVFPFKDHSFVVRIK